MGEGAKLVSSEERQEGGGATVPFPFAAGGSRLGPILGLPRLLEELGVSPQQAFREADVRTDLFTDPENSISQEAVCRLLSVCAALSGRDDFGLLLGARFALADFGVLGELMRNSDTVGEAMRMLLLHLHYYDRAAIPVLFRAESTSVFLGYSLQHPAEGGAGQLHDTAMAVAHRALRELCGPTWRPLYVQLSHHRPGNSVSYRRFFGPAVQFDAELSGLGFSGSWLERHIAGADQARHRLLNQTLRAEMEAWPISLAEEVQCVLRQLLHGGNVSAASVARLFGLSERTLRQQLSREGASLQQLLTETRFELARHLLQGTDLRISDIAAALCYADSAVFSRAFHGWAGLSPRQWRNLNRKQ